MVDVFATKQWPRKYILGMADYRKRYRPERVCLVDGTKSWLTCYSYTTIRRTAVRYRPASGSVRLVSLHKSTPTRSVPFESEEIPGAAQSSVFSARTCTSVSTSPSDTSISSNENATESSVTCQDAYSNLTVSPGPEAITSFIRKPVPKRPSTYSVINPHYKSAATAEAIPYANAAWCLSQRDRMSNSYSQSRYARVRLRRTPLRSRQRPTNRYTIASSWCKSITRPRQLWDTARTRYRRWKLPSRCDREKAGVSLAASRTRRRTGRNLQSGTSRRETTVPWHRETHTQEKSSKHFQRKSLR